jgi:hypothetical protein
MKCTGQNCPLNLGNVEKCTAHNCEHRTKHKTNYDKLTSSVDALAAFLAKTIECYFCPIHEIYGVSKCQGEKMCADILKEWLQKECEE